MDKKTELKNFDKEAKIWYMFYTTFNDADMHHADNAFFNRNFTNSMDVHIANINWAREIIRRGLAECEILDYLPNSMPYISSIIDEAMGRLNIKKEKRSYI